MLNTKVLMAFVAGAAIASGLVYVAVRPKPVVQRPGGADNPVYVASGAQPASATSKPAPDPVTNNAPEQAEPAPVQAAPTPVKPAAPGESYRPRPKHKAVVRRIADRRLDPTPAPVPVVNPAPDPVASTPQPQEAASAAPAPAPVAPPPPARAEVLQPQPAPPPAPVPHTVTIPPGTLLSVRLGEALSTVRNQAGDTFTATLDQPLVIDGFILATRGARLQGRVVEADTGGRTRGVARLGIELTRLNTSDGQHLPIRTTAFQKTADAEHAREAAKVGGGAALGAIIGAIAGGGKGAGIGAVVGGAAGGADVLLTRGRAAQLPVETHIMFRIADPITITERLN